MAPRPGASAKTARTSAAEPEFLTVLAVPRVTSTSDGNRPTVLLDSPLLTATAVAELLAVPRSSVYEYARRRHEPLPSLLIGRHRRFDRRAVERWLSAQLGQAGA
jgi:excisionase family DNA binding protein